MEIKGKRHWIKELVIPNKVKRVYDVHDINKWIKFGMRKGLINRNNKEDVIKWISLLKGINFKI
jgi:hypothetical protein